MPAYRSFCPIIPNQRMSHTKIPVNRGKILSVMGRRREAGIKQRKDTTVNVGDIFTWQRTFSEEDITRFAQLSGDHGVQHLQPDEHGRIMAHGLLTATLPTKIGGDLNFIAHHMTFHFVRPVYAGDTVTCEVRIQKLEQKGRCLEGTSTWTCRNQKQKVVLTGEAVGIILNTSAPAYEDGTSSHTVHR